MSTRISKFLSLVLRHDPDRIGITLDEAGWTDVAALLDATAAHGVVITPDELARIVASSDKQRFAMSADGVRIRANQGHSVEVDLALAPATPPAILFHGTVEPALAGIRARGLIKGARHHVHLSADLETAQKVGGRRGKAIILSIRAADMVAAGHVFYRSENGVWLVDHVPITFIEVPDSPARHSAGGGNRSMKVTIAKTSLAACEAGGYVNAHGAHVDLAPALAAAKAGTVIHAFADPTVVEPARPDPAVAPAAIEAPHVPVDATRDARPAIVAVAVAPAAIDARADHASAEATRDGRPAIVAVAPAVAPAAIDARADHAPAEATRDGRPAIVAVAPVIVHALEPRAAGTARTAIAVTGETTIDALVRVARAGGHLGCLNFASAKNPGGGFLGGAQAQEESLARSSGLYPCQTAVPEFYAANRANHSPLYLDRALYSPLVPFFRDDDGRWFDTPVLASVITCPAPNASALRQQHRLDVAELERVLRRRAALVLAVARHHAIDRLVLGAWGAGVFGNDPAVVADAFKTLLAGDFAGAFTEVVFAVLGSRESSANHRAFADAFA